MGEWIEWKGKPLSEELCEMPNLPKGTLVDVQFRDGGISLGAVEFEQWGTNWNDNSHFPNGDPDAIVAYRVRADA